MNQHVSVAIRAAESGMGQKPVPRDKLRLVVATSLAAADFTAIVLGYICTVIVFKIQGDALPFAKISLTLLLVNALFSFIFRTCVGNCVVNVSESVRRSGASLLLSLMFMSLVITNLRPNLQGVGLFITSITTFALLFMVALRAAVVAWGRKLLAGKLYSVICLADGDYPSSVGEDITINVGHAFDPANATAEDYHRLAGILSAADRVVVRCTKEKRAVWTHVLQGMNVHAEILAPEMSKALALGHYAGRATFVVARGPLNLRDRLLKRFCDVVLSSLILLVLAPLMAIVALAIKLESPGPVFFVQDRIGRQNRLFKIFKFRSMYTEQCDFSGSQSSRRDDDRITKVGKFIRKTSIDELPQLFNVLFGTMSIVGPRPHAISSTAKSKLFWEVDSRYWHRHACKPGITGLAQVRGFRGATMQERDLTDRLESDLEYLANWSLWNDMMIMVRTFAVVMHKNAF